MKPITIHVSETVYAAFQEYARATDRPTSELIRDAMELYQRERIRPQRSLREWSPLSLGRILKSELDRSDIFDEMIDD